jgi:putative two-component system response regulator
LSKSRAPLFQLASEIALHHHERWDGAGYPDGLTGAHISEASRIVAVADVFDALSMRRPYKDAWPVSRVLDALRESVGSHLDARVVSAFMRVLPEILSAQAHWNEKEETHHSIAS